ncbi:MAG: Xaa-Pro peptidase family protein [bacterium]
MNGRLERIRKRMRKMRLDAVIITSRDNVFYVSGFTGSSGNAIITLDKALFVTDSRYTLQAAEQCKGFEVKTHNSSVDAIEFLYEQLQELAIIELRFEPAAVTVDQLRNWRRKMPGIRLRPLKDLLGSLRLVKDESEIQRIIKAVKIVDAAFEHILGFIKEGKTEYEIGLEIEFFIRKQGGEIGFAPIVVSGPRSALPHGQPTNRAIKNGEFLTLDFGAKLDGYNSDITRTVVIGKADNEHRRIYNAVLDAQQKAVEAVKPGVSGCEVDAVARDLLGTQDLAKYFGHGLGHSLGIAVHDGSVLNPNSKEMLASGQVWTIEPGVYIEDFGGVRIEDDVVVTDNGYEILTQSTKQLIEIK